MNLDKRVEDLFKGKSLMITGGTGSFGKTVLHRFLETEIKEIIIFSRDEKKQEDLRLRLNNPKLKFILGDVRCYDTINNAMKGVDYVFHAAALKQVPSCDFFPLEATKTNILGSENVINAAINHNVKKLISSSSASVYGDALEVPMTESHPFNNKNFYGATKIAGEAMATAFNDRYGLEVVSLRYMNVYGPGQDQHAVYSGVVPIMLNKIEAGEQPVINGDGSQAYDFVYVEDVAKANICALESDIKTGNYNVGTEVQTTIKELCDTILDLKNSEFIRFCGRLLSKVFIQKRNTKFSNRLRI